MTAARATLVDSNVILDVVGAQSPWRAWSRSALREAADGGVLAIDPIVYAEVSVGFDAIEDVDGALLPLGFERRQFPWPAAFLAGKAFLAYRRRGGTRASPLPDFFIGAHAAVAGLRLLTRDPGRYRTYFPTVELLAP